MYSFPRNLVKILFIFIFIFLRHCDQHVTNVVRASIFVSVVTTSATVAHL